MSSTGFRQDMPPPGGYSKINVDRVPAKKLFGGPTLIIGFLGVTTAAFFMYWRRLSARRLESIERYDSLIALEPFLLAERDREYLKQLRRNRDEEAKLMKNVEGWQVGTLYGEPIYKTVPKDTLIEPIYNEFYAHATKKESEASSHFKFWH